MKNILPARPDVNLSLWFPIDGEHWPPASAWESFDDCMITVPVLVFDKGSFCVARYIDNIDFPDGPVWVDDTTREELPDWPSHWHPLPAAPSEAKS